MAITSALHTGELHSMASNILQILDISGTRIVPYLNHCGRIFLLFLVIT